MAKIVIKYQDIAEQCNRLHKVANEIKDILTQIQNESFKVSTSDLWVGNASDHFYNYVKKLSKNYDEIYNELEASILYLASSSDGYGAVDNFVLNDIMNNLNITSPENYSSKVYR